MIIVKHPTIPGIQREVAEEDVPRWESQGWVPLLNADQRQRLNEIEAEVERACPTCGVAVGSPCVTPSGTPAKHTHKSRLSA